MPYEPQSPFKFQVLLRQLIKSFFESPITKSGLVKTNRNNSSTTNFHDEQFLTSHSKKFWTNLIISEYDLHYHTPPFQLICEDDGTPPIN